MATAARGGGFRYPYPLTSVLEPWRKYLRDGYDRVVADLTERERLLEDWTDIVPVFDQILVDESTQSTTPVDLSTVGPTVTVKLPRGKCTITTGALVYSSVTNQSAYTETWMDGAFLQSGVILGNNTGGSLSVTMSHTSYFDNLDPGEHEFQVKYAQTLPGNDAFFDARFLLIDPVP